MSQDARTQFGTTGFTITKSDATVFTMPTSVFVGGAGDVVVQPYDNATASTLTFTMPAGSVVPVQVRRVLSTGTTATALVGLT